MTLKMIAYKYHIDQRKMLKTNNQNNFCIFGVLMDPCYKTRSPFTKD